MSDMQKKQNFLQGTALLAMATAIVKVIGALYKIPLNAIIGEQGFGYFNTAYDIYNVLLMISTAGLPVAMSRMISQASSLDHYNQVRRIYHTARGIFLALGIAGSLLMTVFCRQLAAFQNQPDAWAAIGCLGPCVLLICVMSTYRGFFQGQGNMLPTSVSQVLEAVVKLIVGMGAALAILTGQSTVMVTVFAFLASLLSVALVYLVGRRSRGSRVVSLLLAGIMVGSLFSACTSYIKLVADPSNQLPQITYWLMGSLSGTRMHTVAFAAVCMAAGLTPLLLLRWRMNLLTLSPDEARAMGVHTDRLRLAVILCATVLTASAVSVSGMIGWVGLVIPHLSRRLVGNDCRRLLPMACLFGAAFLLLVDDLARTLAATEIPIGILTAFVGAPFFIYLMVKGGDCL